MKNPKEFIEGKKLAAFFRMESQEQALNAAKAVIEGGISVIEITLTTPGAFEIIQELRQNREILLAAGTVLNVENAQKVVDLGADIIISPHTDPDIVQFCKETNVVSIPAAATPTEIFNAWNLGADYVKIFPAFALGGPAFIKAIRGPFPFIKFYPTNGVTPDNFLQYLRAGASTVGLSLGGADTSLVSEGNYSAVTEAVRMVVKVLESAENI